MSTQTIGRYQIRREIGRGGMATVYHAYDPQFERDVALKLLPREFLHDPEFRRRFHREAKTIASLEHPAIVPVHDFGDADGQLYLVMRLMSGGSLKSRMQKGPIPVTEIARIFARIAQALDSAHALGIVHRDLKPDNILFDQWDEPYLADFGIVKLVQSSKTALTATGGIVGTPAYMSPEQVRSNEQLDGRSDLYALGVILFEMLTGQQPYQANTPIGQAIMHINEPVPRVLAANPSLPEGCQRLIDRVMAKDKENRPDTAEMLAREVAALATPPGDPSPVSPPEQKPVDPPELEAWPETELMIHPDLAPDLPQSAPSSEKADEPSAQRPPVAAAPNADPLATIEDSLPFSPTPAQPAAKPGQPAPSPDPAGADPFLAAPQRSAIPAKPVQTPPAPSPVTAEPPPRLATRFPGARRRWWVIGAPLMLVAALILLLVLRPWSAPSSANGEDGPATLSAYMSQKWEAGYEATALAYGGGQWAMVMSLGAPDVRQSWRLSGEFPAEFIQEKWRDGFDLVDLAYGRGQWALIFSHGGPDRRQSFVLDDQFPEAKINEKWQEGYQISSLAYGRGQWALIMSRDEEDRRQSWRLTSQFPEEYIGQRWQDGYQISALAYGDRLWAVVMTLDEAGGRQSWRLATDFPRDYISEKWADGYNISALSYGTGHWAIILSLEQELQQTWRLSADFN